MIPGAELRKTGFSDSLLLDPPNDAIRASSDYAANAGRTGKNDGVFGQGPNRFTWRPNVKINETAFTDGLSNTVFVGERRIETDYYIGPNDFLRKGYASNQETVYACDIGNPSLPNPPKNDSYKRKSIFPLEAGSAHSSGMNAVFGDGSVHLITYTIDAQVWLNLCSRNDGNVVTIPD